MDDPTLTNILRWFHVLAGDAWPGEVVVINIVLVPVLASAGADKRHWLLGAVFPRVFRLASFLSLTALLAGAVLNLSTSDWQLEAAINRLVSSRWGWGILIGGLLGLGLTLFHFVFERRLQPFIDDASENMDDEAFSLVLRRLRIIPRIGLGVLVVIFLSMMFAVRGL